MREVSRMEALGDEDDCIVSGKKFASPSDRLCGMWQRVFEGESARSGRRLRSMKAET